MGFFTRWFGDNTISDSTQKDMNKSDRRPDYRSSIKQPDENGYYPIICPYCMEKFNIWEVEFRASDGSITREEGIQSNEYGDNSLAGLDLFGENTTKTNASNIEKKAEESDETLTAFPREIDEKKVRFQKRVGKMRVHDSASAENKILRLFDEQGQPTGEVVRVLLMDRGGNASGDWIYLDGITKEDPRIYKKPLACVQDMYNKITYDRVCPCCHNKIINILGLFPNYVIGIVGNTFCGKTVYISKLCDALASSGIFSERSDNRFSGTGEGEEYAPMVAENIDRRARYGEALFDPTRIEYIEPRVLRCSRGQGKERTQIVLTLFDFPGEALQPGKQIRDFFNHYCMVKHNVDGWMFLFDSSNFRSVNDIVRQNHDELVKFLPDNLINEGYSDTNDGERRRAVTMPPLAVLQAFCDNLLKGQFTAPVAFVITKSDMLVSIKDDIRKQAPDSMIPDPDFLKGFDYTHVDKIDLDKVYQNSEEIQKMLKDGLNDWTAVNAKNNLSDEELFAWFAVSAMGTQVASGYEAALARPIRVEEPVAWLLYMLGVLPGESNDNSLWR